MTPNPNPSPELREALEAALAKRSVPTMDPPYTAAFNAALDMVARDTAAARALSPQTLPAPGEVEQVVASVCSYCGLVTTANLPDIEAEGERVAADTWKHPSGMYLWTDMLGAIQTAIADERARHTTLATVAAANDEGVAGAIETGQFLLDRLVDHEVRMTSDPDAREWYGHVAPAMERFRAAIRLLSQGGRK